MKYLIYARISERGSSSEGETSIDMQLEYCRRYIAERQGEIVREVQDVYISGKSLNRPGIRQVLTECRSGAADWDCLCVYSLSRLTRSPRDLYKVIDVLVEQNKRFISATEPEFDFTSITGEMLMGIISHVNQYVRKIGGKTTRDKMISIARQGLCPYGLAPFGYKRGAHKDNRLYVDEPNAAIVKDVFNMYTSPNYTTGDIVKKYKGVLTKKRVLNILKNPTYTGVISYAGEVYPGKHEPIISKAQFAAAKSIRPQTVYSARPKAQCYQYLLTGLLRCSCGCAMTPTSAKSGKYFYYTCINPDCRRRISAPQTERDILDYLRMIRITPKVLEYAKKRIEEKRQKALETAAPRLKIIAEELEKINAEQDKLVDTLLKSDLSKAITERINAASNKLMLQTAALEAEKQALLISTKDLSREFSAAAEILNNFLNFPEAEELLKLPDRTALRNYIRLRISSIRLNADNSYQIFLSVQLLAKSSTNGDKWYAVNHLLELLNTPIRVSVAG